MLSLAGLSSGGQISRVWCWLFIYTATQFGLAVAVWLRCRWARIPAMAVLLMTLCFPIYYVWLACTEGTGPGGPPGKAVAGFVIAFSLVVALVFAAVIGLVVFWLYRLKLGPDTSISPKENT